jgi:hypothetical protein
MSYTTVNSQHCKALNRGVMVNARVKTAHMTSAVAASGNSVSF